MRERTFPELFGALATLISVGFFRLVFIASLASFAAGCAGAAGGVRTAAPPPPPRVENVRAQILSPSTEGTEKELFARGEQALLGQKWREAADCFETLLAAGPSDAAMAEKATF